MELSEELDEKVGVKQSQLANKMTRMDGGTLEGTSHEEREAMVALKTVHRLR